MFVTYLSYLALLLLLPGRPYPIPSSSENDERTRILVVTGGRSIDEAAFSKLLNSLSEVVVERAEKPDAFQIFASDEIERYAAVLFYDMYESISEEQKEAFLRIFELGVGAVFLHHSLVSHQEWGEYEQVVGGRYFESTWEDDGRVYGPSTYRHDQDYVVRVLQPYHPVTAGLDDFRIRDETYLNYRVKDFVTPLLTTDYRASGEKLAWTHTYRNSRIVYIMLGHDRQAYEHSSLRQLLAQALLYVARF